MLNYYPTIALISHTSKVMLKILQYMNCELPDVQAGFRKGRNQRSNCQHPLYHQKSKRVSEKYLFLLYFSILKEISPGCSLEGLMLKLKLPILWPPDAKGWLTGKAPDLGKDWGQEEKGTTEDEMVGWHYRLNRHGFGWTPGVGDGQGGLLCCSSRGCKESDTTEWQLNWYILHDFGDI